MMLASVVTQKYSNTLNIREVNDALEKKKKACVSM